MMSILERILSSETKNETVNIGFGVEMRNGKIESIEWSSRLSRRYDVLST